MMTPQELRSHVDTIVVLMFENRSFDNVLGHLSHPDFGNRVDVDGIRDLDHVDWLNQNGAGIGIAPFWMNDDPLITDLPHELDRVRDQLAFSAMRNAYSMNGFVRAYEAYAHSAFAHPATMGLLRPDGVPVTTALANQYTVCDRWFSCAPTSTAPNRLLSMCGTTSIDETNVVVPNTRTVYDWCRDRDIPFRVYAAGLPFFTLMPRMHRYIYTHEFRRFDELASDVVQQSNAEWPNVIFIEPDYTDSPIHFRSPCCNHPPTPMAPGEAFLAETYAALTANPDRWARTVFIVTYDEHGGFWDHVPPAPITFRNGTINFATTGPRLPVVVCGPFAPRGAAHELLDNTSILQLIAERFGNGETYSSEVAERALQGVRSVSTILDAGADNTQVLSPPAVANAAQVQPSARSAIYDGFVVGGRDLVAQDPSILDKYPELANLP